MGLEEVYKEKFNNATKEGDCINMWNLICDYVNTLYRLDKLPAREEKLVDCKFILVVPIVVLQGGEHVVISHYMVTETVIKSLYEVNSDKAVCILGSLSELVTNQIVALFRIGEEIEGFVRDRDVTSKSKGILMVRIIDAFNLLCVNKNTNMVVGLDKNFYKVLGEAVQLKLKDDRIISLDAKRVEGVFRVNKFIATSFVKKASRLA